MFQTPSERGNGSLTTQALYEGSASEGFKPLQSGAMVHCSAVTDWYLPECLGFKPLQSGAMVHWASHHG